MILGRGFLMACGLAVANFWAACAGAADDISISETETAITIATPEVEAVVRKEGYVTGVAAASFLDKKTGFRDAGYGLDIVDWIMEPGSDLAYRDKLAKDLVYEFGNAYHGKTAKRSLEGPQICTQAKKIDTLVVRGANFVAVKLWYKYHLAAPNYKTGSLWTQWLVFPKGKRYFISSDRIDAVNSSPAMFLRLDMPGHIKHKQGDTFSELYLSYYGPRPLAAKEFFTNFAPDEKFNYQRAVWEQEKKPLPERFIRAYHLRDAKTGAAGPWLAGLTLEPSVVSEAWCHQRDYVCLIEEFGGRPIKAGESFSAAFIVGYFDTLEEMHKVYDEYRGHTGLVVHEQRWQLTK